MKNQKQVVLITGAAKGIGRHLAQCFSRKNYQVIATDIDIETLKKGWNTEGVHCEKLDVTKPNEWATLMLKIKNQYGQLDICINNAGVITPGYIKDLDVKTIDYQIDVNTKGVMYGTKYAADLMMPQGFGHIINLASLAGVAPINGISIYSASKFAVRGFSLAIVPELRAYGIQMSVICPDLVDTDMLTLQLDYEAAALTFSGNAHLTVKDIENAVFNRALERKEIEILVPRIRGLTAKIGNFFPNLGFKLTSFLTSKGLENLEKIKEKRAKRRLKSPKY
jgi:3-oxoacyl-[acyl-carrier protein] reductase